MAINWKQVQQRLGVPDDGVPGPITYHALIKTVAPKASKEVAKGFAKYIHMYHQDHTAERLADFIAQTTVESGGYQRFVENLNYSAKRLTQVWPSRFPSLAAAQPFANNPGALANKVYGGRMGNDQPGDGAKYIGRGILQLTGKDNYRLYGALIGVKLLDDPNLAADPILSVLIALEYYRQRNVNEAVDKGQTTTARRRVNGGTHGLTEVNANRAKLLKILK